MTVWTPVAEFLSCQSWTVYKRVWSIATAVQFSYRFLKLFNAHNPCHQWNRRQCCLHDHSLMQDSSQCEIDWLKMCPAVKGFMETTPSRMLVGKFSLPTGRQNHDPPTKWWVEDRKSFKGNKNAFWRNDMEWSLLLLKILTVRFLRYLSVSTFRWSWRPRTCGNSLTHKGPPANMYMIDMIEGDLSSEVLEICWWLYNIFVWYMPKQCRRYSISQKSRAGFPAVFIEFSPNFGRDALMILQIGWVTVSEHVRTPKYNVGMMGEPLSCIQLLPDTLKPPSSYPVGFVRTKGTPRSTAAIITFPTITVAFWDIPVYRFLEKPKYHGIACFNGEQCIQKQNIHIIDRSIDVSMYRCIDVSIYRSINLSIYRSIDLSSYLSIYLSIYLATYLSIYLASYLSIYEWCPHISWFNIVQWLKTPLMIKFPMA